MSVKIALLFVLVAFISIGITDACPCPRIYWPVCGSDGVTYSNVQCMRCHRPSLRVMRQGPCKKLGGIIHPRTYDQTSYSEY